MNKRIVISIAVLLLCAVAAQLYLRIPSAAPEAADTELPPVDALSAPTPVPPPVSDAAPYPAATPEPTYKRSSWTLSFAGDCTIGTPHEWQNIAMPHNMLYRMGNDWSYPFSNVADVFSSDDLTLVNLEGTFTDHNQPVAKKHRFRASPETAQCLLLGSVEAVTLANNHSGDYGEKGLADTRQTLDDLGVLRCENDRPIITQLEDGPKLGIVAFSTVEIDLDCGDIDAYLERIMPQYDLCLDADCDIVMIYLHWGWEYRTQPEQWMTELAHELSDRGFDIVIGSHPHILQPVEFYNDTPIFYSLGNFCFGGHSGPDDMDSVIVQQQILREGDGFVLGATSFLPCSISSSDSSNDFRPRLFGTGEDGYTRTMQKLGLK